MKLRNLILLFFCVITLIFSCKKEDDNNSGPIPVRDRAEVYLEDIAEIEAYLETHFYNYEEFDFNNSYSNPANDEFKVVLDTIDGLNSDKTPLIDQVSQKTVTDDSGVEYVLYYLVVREGLGKSIHALDRAIVNYEGNLLDNETFDSSAAPIPFNLTAVGFEGGVVQGFREGLLEFKTSTDFTDNADGTTVYHNHGIGLVFIPSGLGYFENFVDGDGVNDDTDGDNGPNFLDPDDDQDDVPTSDEIVTNTYNMPTKQEIEDLVLADNEILISNQKEADGTYTGVTMQAFFIPFYYL